MIGRLGSSTADDGPSRGCAGGDALGGGGGADVAPPFPLVLPSAFVFACWKPAPAATPPTIGGGPFAALILGRLLAPRFAARCCCTMVGGAGAVVPKGERELAYRLSMEAMSPEMTGRIPSSAAPPAAPLRSTAVGRGDVDDVAAAISPNIRRARDDCVGPSGPGAVEPYGLKELVYRASRAVLSPDITGFCGSRGARARARPLAP